MPDKGLRFDLLGRDKSLGRTLDKGGRDIDRFSRRSRDTLGRAGDDGGRRFGMRLNKSLGGGMTASAGIVRRGAGLIGAGFAAAGVAKFAKDAVGLATTFDKTMRQVATVSKLPASQIANLRDVALDMGAKTSFSAKQAGDAMLELAKGGLTAAEIKAGGLKATLTLAAAGGLELGEAANFVVKSLGQFGLKVDKAADVAAALAGGANASTASVQDLGLALSQVGPGARNAGLSLQETVAVLGAFSDNGIRGADAGTSLKTMLVSLVPTTDKAARTMRKLGLDFTDAHGAIIPVTQIAQQLQDRLGKLSQAQRIAALQTIFGSDATRAATVLMQQGAAGLARYIKATNDRAAAEKLAKENTKGAAGAFERLSGAIETVQIKAGTALLPVLADAATTIADDVIPAGERWTKQLISDLQPEMGRLRQTWDDNRFALEGFASGLVSAGGSMDATGVQAESLATKLADVGVAGVTAGGDVARFVTWLDQNFRKFTESSNRSFEKLGEGMAKRDPLFRGLRERLLAIDGGLEEVSTSTDRAVSAAERHKGALAGEKQALDALQGSLDQEKNAELNLRQAKLNVQTAQKRLNDLKADGRTKSLDYKQAQLDLERAQGNLKEQTGKYKDAQLKANAAAGGAMRVSQGAAGSYRTLAGAAFGARQQVVQFALKSSEAIRRLRGKTLNVTANYNIGAPKGIELLIEKGLVRARGGPIDGPGTATSDSIPAWLSKGEHVWSAREVQGAGGHEAVEGMRRRARGYAAGGPVLDFRQTGTEAFGARPGRFDRNIARSLELAARGFGELVRANKDQIFGVGKPEVTRFIRSTDPLNYGWGGAGPFVYDCSGITGAVQLAHLGRPYGHGQRLYTTGTIRAGIAGLKPGLGGVLEIGVTAGTGHMAGRYGGKRGLGFEAESTRTGIKIGSAASRPESFARHFHLAKGGRIDPEMIRRFAELTGLDIGGDQGRLRVNGKVYDQGGWLMPGATLAVNRTGRPEPVGIDEDRLAHKIALELAKVLPTTIRVDEVHRGLLAHKRGRGGIPLGIG
jgi:TP901 family phage tail tape measure protein